MKFEDPTLMCMHGQLSVFGLLSTYMTYLNVPLYLVFLPWILANILAANSHGGGGGFGGGGASLGGTSGCGGADVVADAGSRHSSSNGLMLFLWPNRSVPILLALPLLPLGHLCVFLSIMSIIQMNLFLYCIPMLMAHIMAAVLQTVSLLVTGSLLTASIREQANVSFCNFVIVTLQGP